MSYEPTIWKKGDVVTSEKLNKIEQGIADISGSNDSILVPEQTKGYNADLSFVDEGDGSYPSQKTFVYGPFEGTLGDVGNEASLTLTLNADGGTLLEVNDYAEVFEDDGSSPYTFSRCIEYYPGDGDPILLFEDLNDVPGVVAAVVLSGADSEADALFATVTATLEVTTKPAGGIGGGDSDIFVVHFYQDVFDGATFWASREDFEAIYEAFDAGKVIFAVGTGSTGLGAVSFHTILDYIDDARIHDYDDPQGAFKGLATHMSPTLDGKVNLEFFDITIYEDDQSRVNYSTLILEPATGGAIE